MIIVNVLSATYDSVKRLVVKFIRYGLNDTQTAIDIAPYGTDANPIPGTIALYDVTPGSGDTFIVGYLIKNRLAASGEHRIFSTDNNGDLKAYIWAKNNGNLELNGNADNAIRYANTAEVIKELQNDLKTLKQAFTTWVTVPNDGGAALKAVSATWSATPLQQDITKSKIDTVLTP